MRAIRDLVAQKAIHPKHGKHAEDAINAALEQIPRPASEFEVGHEDKIVRLVHEHERKGKER